MLRKDVIEAAEDDKFHIYPVETADEGIQILTGLEMGEADEEGNYPEGTINYKVVKKLDKLASDRKSFVSSKNGKENG
ncbi:MAG: hypothetical protein U5K69_07385 [Balneolaceae bacterium]|nr:hypothetical protein [Balneolaceae bacterium]